jgi:hypothetical protein
MGSSYTASGYFEIGGRTPSQSDRICIFQTQISGWKVDSGGIGQLLDAEIRFFEGNVRAIDTVRSRIQTVSGFFCSSDVKKIPNAILLGNLCRRLMPVGILANAGFILFEVSDCIIERPYF